MIDESLDAAIVGGGVSGSSLAVALSSRAGANFKGAIFERADLGPGTAYTPQSASLLVNGPVRAMSALARDKKHLERWLVDEHEDALVCRARYGAYMRATAAAALAAHSGLTHVRDEVIDVERTDAGFRLETASGKQYAANSVVLALGNFSPSESFLPQELRSFQGFARDPWRVDVAPFENRDVILIGNRLTAMDVIALLDERAFRGRVHLVSRHGLIPTVEDARIRGIDLTALGLEHSTPQKLVRSLRKIVAEYSGDWRAVVEGIRPMSAHIWAQWSLVERRRFLRHVASIWGVHRYRVPAAVFASYSRMKAENRVVNHRGRIIGAHAAGETIALEIQRGDDRTLIRGAYVVNCSGPNSDVTSVDNRLVQNLLARELIRPDPLHLGLDCSPCFHVIGKHGETMRGLFAMGPLLRGLWYESTAVPEITVHADAIAAELLSEVANGDVGVAI